MAIASYTINGKFDKKPITQAQVHFEKFQQSMKTMSLVVKTFAIAKVMQVGASAINGATDAYREQEMQLKRLTNAVNTNANLTEGAFDRLQEQVSQLSDAAIFSGEDLTKGQAYLSTMKLNEEQIKKVMNAATNLASAGVMPLDGAIKNLSKTFAGEVGELKDLNPALKNLTEEQFKNGEAVALIAEQYKGFNEIMANSEHGKALQFANSFDDLRKTLGEIIQSIKNISFSKMLTPLRNITAKLKESKDKIINFFRYLPEIIASTITLIDGMMKKVFTFEFLVTSLKAVLNIAITYFFNSLKIMISSVKLIASFIWEPLSYAFDLMIFGVQKAFGSVINFCIDKINYLASSINKISGALGLGEIKQFSKIEITSKKPKNKIWENIKGSFKDLKNSITEGVDSVSSAVKDAGADYSQIFGDEFKAFSSKLGSILGRENKKQNKKPTKGIGSDGTQSSSGSSDEKDSEDVSFLDILTESAKSAGGAIGWMANVAEQVAKTGNPLVILGELLKVILAGFFEILAPVVNSLFIPLFGILRALGKFLGLVLAPVLKILEPVIRVVSKAFLFLYNYVLRPISNGLIFIFNLLYNGFAGFMNGLRKLVQIVTFGAVDIGYTSYKSLDEGMLEKIDEADLVQEGSQALGLSGGATSSANASAGVSAARASKPTEVNIHFTSSFVNGDAREIALMLRKEIANAEKMGY